MSSDSNPSAESGAAAAVGRLAGSPPPWVLYVLLGGVAGLTALGYYVSAAWPRLLANNPELLLALSNRYRWFILTAPKVDIAPHLALGIGRSMLSDPLYFLLGYLYGDDGLKWARKNDKSNTVVTTERLFARVRLVLCAFFAGPLVCALAGASRMRPRTFFLVNLAGTATLYVVMRLLASLAFEEINSLLRFNLRHNRTIMITTIAITLVTVAIAVRGRKAESGSS